MVKKILFLSTILLLTLIPNLEVNAIQVGSLNGLNITQNENGTNVQYSLMNDYFSYSQGGTRYIFSHSDNLMWKGISVSSADEYTYTTNLNYYFTNPCGSTDNVSYNQRIAFFFVNTDEYRLNTLNVVNNINGCSGYWTKEDSTYYYNQSCSLSAGSPILGSLYFSEPNLGSWQVSNYRIGIQDDFDVKCEVNTNALVDNNNANTQNIINNNTNNTNQIIEDNQQNTQDIIDNQNQNTQDVIDNQNQNTQEQIQSQKVCNTFLINKDTNFIASNSYLDQSGIVTPINENYAVTDYYLLGNNSSLLVTKKSLAGGRRYCFYDNNKDFISCNQGNQYNPGTYITIPSNSKYIRFTIDRSLDSPNFEFYTCQNGNQALNDSVNGLNDTLKSDTPPDTENEISSLESDLISDTPITDLLTLPITLLNSYISGFSGSCSPYNLGNLYGTDLILPCLNLQQRLGSNLWTIIDSLFSIFMIYNIAMLMIQAFEGFTSLRDDYEGLYQPRHADLGYQPKHGGGGN